MDKRTASDPQVRALEKAIADAVEPDRGRLVVELAELRTAIRAEKISEVAAEFDGVHSIHRAVQFGSVDAVISASHLLPEIIAVLERGLADQG